VASRQRSDQFAAIGENSISPFFDAAACRRRRRRTVIDLTTSGNFRTRDRSLGCEEECIFPAKRRR
jgi:hypothetical protein